MWILYFPIRVNMGILKTPLSFLLPPLPKLISPHIVGIWSSILLLILLPSPPRILVLIQSKIKKRSLLSVIRTTEIDVRNA
jgi:hypothetical protein